MDVVDESLKGARGDAVLRGWQLWSTMVSVEQSVGQVGTKGPRLSPQPQRVPSSSEQSQPQTTSDRKRRAPSAESEIECTSPTRSTCLVYFPLPSGGERASERAIEGALMRQACPLPRRASSRRQRALPATRQCLLRRPLLSRSIHWSNKSHHHITSERLGVVFGRKALIQGQED